MFLRNFDNFLFRMTGFIDYPMNNYCYGYINDDTIGYINQSGQFTDGCVNMKSTNGTIKAMTGVSSVPRMISLNENNICLGTGNTEVTYDDYKLSGDVVDNTKLTYQSHEFTFNEDTHRYTKKVIFTYSNTDSNNITISEWGLWLKYGSGLNSKTTFSNNDKYNALLYREVLDEPITIPAGTTSTLTFEIDFPMLHRV